MNIFIKENLNKLLFFGIFLIFLPNFEAPKNLLILGFSIVYVFHFFKEKTILKDIMVLDYIFLAWILISVIVSLNAIYFHNQPGAGFADVFRYILFGWVISKIRFNDQFIRNVAYISLPIVLASVILNVYYYDYGLGFKFHSVGHINHSAIYFLLNATICLSLLFFDRENKNIPIKFFLFLFTIFSFFFIEALHSRAVFGLFAILLVFVYLIYLYISKKRTKVIVFGLAFFSFLALTAISIPEGTIHKIITQSHTVFSDDSARAKIRNMAYYVYKIDPIFGVGMDNFPNFDLEDIKNEVISDKGYFDKEKYMPFAHPHNIYYAHLVGGGIIGLIIFIIFWLTIIYIINESRKKMDLWLIFSVAGIVLINMLIGLFNTTFANENAIFSMMFIGFFLSRYRYKNINNL